jgi:hypothetical protein
MAGAAAAVAASGALLFTVEGSFGGVSSAVELLQPQNGKTAAAQTPRASSFRKEVGLLLKSLSGTIVMTFSLGRVAEMHN